MHGVDEDGSIGAVLADGLHHVEAVGIGQLQVQDEEVELAIGLQQLREPGVGGDALTQHVRLARQQVPDAFEHHGMVVEGQYAVGVRRLTHVFR